MQKFPILFEDDSMLVIDKPSGVTVNRSETTKSDTVQDWAVGKLNIKDKKFNMNDDNDSFYNRGGIVHRLDKETSGVLVIAKTPEAFARLQQEFKERLVSKTYVALAHGRVVPGEGEIRAPVGRLPWNRKQFGIVAGGRDSVTKYTTLENGKWKMENGKFEYLSLLELYPETGRTHQIRVHLKHIGHPIFADFLYAGRKTSRSDRRFISRVFLHARSLILFHPVTGEKMAFASPLPDDLKIFIEKLEKVE